MIKQITVEIKIMIIEKREKNKNYDKNDRDLNWD